MTERRIGATDISKILGMNPYGGQRQVYERIVNRVDPPWNDRMRRGIEAEPAIRELAVSTYGLALEPHPGIVQSARHEFATASPDDFAEHNGERVLVEYKSVNEWAARKWGDADWSDAVPEHYHLQVRWSMWVCELERALLVAAFGADETLEGKGQSGNVFYVRWMHVYEFRRDREIEAALFRAGERFWRDHVLARVPPPEDPKPKKTRKTKEEATP